MIRCYAIYTTKKAIFNNNFLKIKERFSGLPVLSTKHNMQDVIRLSINIQKRRDNGLGEEKERKKERH